MKRIIIAALIWLGLSFPAYAAFGVTHKGSNSIATGTTVSVTGLTISSGDLILVGCGSRLAANGDVITISDSASDTFTYYEFPTGGTNGTRACVAFTKTTGLSGGSVTATTSGGSVLLLALSVEDVTGFDTSTIEDTTARNTSSAVSTNPNITSGSPTYSADLFYSSFLVGNVTYTEDATWTNTAINVGNGNAKIDVGYIVGAGTSTVTRTGTAASSNWKGIVIGIKASGSAAAVFHGLSAIGAGK